jgi:hypothetical protein
MNRQDSSRTSELGIGFRLGQTPKITFVIVTHELPRRQRGSDNNIG